MQTTWTASPTPPETEPSPVDNGAPRTTESAGVLLCDHRGEGLDGMAQELASSGFELDRTHQLRQTLDRLHAALPALVVLRPLAPRGGTELEAIDAALAGRRVPVLVLGEPGERLATLLAGRANQRELWDLIPADAAVEDLALRMRRLLAQAERLTEMDELRHRAAHDERTDLLRPASFQHRLNEHFSAAQRHKLDLALLLLDLDKFGLVNKHHDHTVGDKLIELVGSVIRDALRTEDVAGRLGGDEFAVLLPYTSKLDVTNVVQRLLEEIHKLSGHIPGARGHIEVSASIGFETYDGEDLDKVQTLRLHAERALREAKRLGGNQPVYYRSLESGG